MEPNMDNDVVQPAWKPGSQLGVAKFRAGAPKSVKRLEQLRFDPINELVETYRKIQKEVEYQEKLRDGVVVELQLNGKPKAYRPDVHHALFDKLAKIGESLLRYNYGRVPETVNLETKNTAPLVVNLTRKGDVYVANDSPEEDD
jgi:hypothetical protein